MIRRIGTAPRRLVAGFLVSAAILSMWVSNAAATLLLMPIGLSVLELGDRSSGAADGRSPGDLAPALVLAIAFGAGIGGVATLIGTPPNLIVFGSGHVTVRQMARAGLILDLIAVAVVVTLVMVLYPVIFG